jgi:hypothetical protein
MLLHPKGSAAKRAALDLSQRLQTWRPPCMNLDPFIRPEAAKSIAQGSPGVHTGLGKKGA